jgi:hypothetical protein
MIPKVMTGGTRFARRVEYVQKGGEAVCQTRNLVSLETAATEMAATAALARGCRSPSYHAILSWAEIEQPSDEQMFEAADLALAELGMAEHQVVVALHRDRDHAHLHLVLNRVHPVTHRAATVWKDYVTLERACRQIEHQQGWSADRGHFDARIVTRADGGEEVQLVAASRQRDGEGRPAQGELARERRTGRRPVSTIINADRDAIAEAFGSARSWDELNLQLAPIGLVYQAKGTGAVLRSTADPADVTKPSSIDRAWSRAKLEQRFGPMSPAGQAGISKGKSDGTADDKPNVARIGTAPPPRARNRVQQLSACGLVRVSRGRSVLLQSHVPGDLVDSGAERVDRLRRAEPGPGLSGWDRLWQEFQTERVTAGGRRADQQPEWESQRSKELARRQALIQHQRVGRDFIYRLLPRGIVRGVFLWFQKQKQEAEWVTLRAEQAAERQALRDQRKAAPAPPRTWREFVELKVKAGDQTAVAVLGALKFREAPRPRRAVAPPRPDPERELVAMRQLRLVDVAGRYGFVLAPGSEADHASVRMKNPAGDVIVIRQDRARGDRFFNTADNGNVIEFVQRRIVGSLADVRQALRPLIGELPPAAAAAGTRPLIDLPAADHTAARQAWMTAKPGIIGFLQNRGILNATLARPGFQSEIRADARGNALFANRDAAGNVVGFEISNNGFKGHPKGCQRTLAVLGSASARRIVVTESGLDALSVAQLEGREDTRYVSLGGAPGRRAFDELRRLAAGADLVVIGTDNDAAGEAIAVRIRDALSDLPALAIERGRPSVGKDWNDTLHAAAAADTRAEAGNDLAAIDNPVRKPPTKARGRDGMGL